MRKICISKNSGGMAAVLVILIIAGIAILAVSVAMTFGLVPALEEVFGVIVEAVGYVVGIYLILYTVWKAIPEPLQHVIAVGMRKIPNLPVYFKRRTIKFEVESEINTALKEFNKEGAGFVEHEVVVDWLTPKEGARRLFFRGGKAFLKMDFNEDKEKTLVEAIVMYCNECLLLGIRQYLERPLMRSIDITFIDELLDKRNAIRGRAYFVQEVIPREIEGTPDVEKYLDKLELLSRNGLFVRVLMPELKEYCGRTQRGFSRADHLAQVEGFIDFLKVTAEKRASGGKMLWLHIGPTIRVGVILVGLTDRLQFEGSKPYIRRTAMDNADGARTVYLVGYNLGVNFVPEIAKEAKQRGIVSRYEVNEYSALIKNEVKRQVVARLSIPDGAGNRFLESYPNMEEWPDLEEENEISIVGGEAGKWEYDIDKAWSKRATASGESVIAPLAGKDAAEVFGVAKLKDGKYNTLRSIFGASNYLSERWIHDGDRIIKK